MTPAEIAKKLTPAQVRALRAVLNPASPVPYDEWLSLARSHLADELITWDREKRIILLTPLGRAVLAELEGK